MIIRTLDLADLAELAAIERQGEIDVWTEELLRAEFAVINSVGLAVERDGALCGYGFFRTCHPEVELLHLMTRPSRRRQGVAVALLIQALADFADQGFAACFLEVRQSNTAAQALYGRLGFKQLAVRRKYYNHPVEDALQLGRDLTVTL